MKIVCDACSAKYSIADDKVKGKVFKIRCKKCSNIIVVRGTAGGAAEEPAAPQFDQKDTRVYDYGYDDGGAAAAGAAGGDADAVWHVVIDQEQVGPLTVAEVQHKFSAGEIDGDTYVWREGFADWQPLSAVDVFAHLAAGGGGGAAAVAGMFGSPAADEQGTVRANADDMFGAAAAGADDGADDAGDLFGARSAPAASSRGTDYGVPEKAAAAPAGGAGSKLRGERNENSVLFSLGNLAALASDAPRASASSSSSSSSSASASSGAAQHGGGEGSGLIDIRSMASAYLGPQGAKKQQAPSVGSIDDLPVFSAAAFSEPAVILPGPVARQNNKTMMFALVGVGALALIAIVLVLVVFLGGKDEAPAVAQNTTAGVVKEDTDKADPAAKTEDDKASATGDTTTTDTADKGATTDTADKGTTDGAGATTEPAKVDEKKDDKKEDRKDSRSSGSSSSRRDRDDKKETKVEEKKPVESSGGCPDEVGCLLSEKPPACCSKYAKGKKKGGSSGGSSGGGSSGGGGGGDLPESLDSGMVKAGVAKVKTKIFGCGDKYPSAKGTLKLSVKVNADGDVTSASVVSSPDPGLGNCAASAMKGAKFGKTQRGGSFKYPFNF